MYYGRVLKRTHEMPFFTHIDYLNCSLILYDNKPFWKTNDLKCILRSIKHETVVKKTNLCAKKNTP